MVLVDTSVWILHFRDKNSQLETLLMNGQVLTHPYIIGELACGNLLNRDEILLLLQALPITKVASRGEILYFIDKHQLMGMGLGYVDIHLLASASLSSVPLWTQDKKLSEAADKMEIGYSIR